MSNEITQTRDLKVLLSSEAMRSQFALALPKHLTAERFCRIAITALTRTPKLAECTQESFMRCLLDLSALGIEPDGRRAHLIPYGKECTLILDYKGIAELIMRSGLVSSIHADKVCDSDDFQVDRGKILCHRINYREERGKAYAFYAIITMKDGSEKAEVMTRGEVESIKARSRAGNSGPWVTDFDEMGKKTVFRRASKWLPLSPEIRDGIEADDDTFGSSLRDVTPPREERVTTNPHRVEDTPRADAPPKRTRAAKPATSPEKQQDAPQDDDGVLVCYEKLEIHNGESGGRPYSKCTLHYQIPGGERGIAQTCNKDIVTTLENADEGTMCRIKTSPNPKEGRPPLLTYLVIVEGQEPKSEAESDIPWE